MNSEFYLKVGDSTPGPFSVRQIHAMLENKEIDLATPASLDLGGKWMPVAEQFPWARNVVNVAAMAVGPALNANQNIGRMPSGFAIATWSIALGAAIILICAAPDAAEQVGPIIGIIAGIFLYFVPSYIASGQHHRNRVAIYVLNLFLGWTIMGWVVALVWALYKETPSQSKV